MVPDGWRVGTLGELTTITSGGTPSRNSSHYWGGDIPWVTTAEVNYNTIFNTAETISEAGLKTSAAKIFPEGTVLIAMYGQGKTRGKVALLGIPAATNQACAALLPSSNHDSEFLYHYLAYNYEGLRSLSNDGSQKNLSGGLIKSIAIRIPPLSEQQKIAEILSTWDKAIETTEKLLANAEAQKRALMQQLLTGKRRLKGFEGSEWKSATLGTVWKVTTGQPAPSSSDDFCDEGVPFLRVSCLAPLLEGSSESSFEKVPPTTVDQYRLRLFPAGTVVFAKSGMSAKLGRVYRLVSDAYLVSHLAALLPNRSKGDERFLFYFLQMFPPSDLVQGDGFPSIKTSQIAERHISLPPRPEQTAIADCLDASEQIAKNYRSRLISLASEKRALMQQLLTGKRRVTV